MEKSFSKMPKRRANCYRTRRPMKAEPENSKSEGFMMRVYVCVILVVACLAMSKMENEKAAEFKGKLRNALSESITVEEARQIGQMCAEKIVELKNDAEKANK